MLAIAKALPLAIAKVQKQEVNGGDRLRGYPRASKKITEADADNPAADRGSASEMHWPTEGVLWIEFRNRH